MTATEPDLLLKQVSRLVGQADKRKRQGNHVAREGNTTNAAPSDERAAARQLFGSGG